MGKLLLNQFSFDFEMSERRNQFLLFFFRRYHSVASYFVRVLAKFLLKFPSFPERRAKLDAKFLASNLLKALVL